jgi:hypothetical protein
MAGLPLHELELLKRWGNHGEFARKLQDLGLVSDLALLTRHVHAVGTAWFLLGREHLSDAQVAVAGRATRAVYSRAYYAVYNFSRTVRFIVHGTVSLKGDDHRSVGNLPSDMPDAITWGSELELLYEHRLRADYDNWSDTLQRYTLTPADCVDRAERFHQAAEKYLLNKAGFKP